MKNIYVTITTLVDWQEKLEEARELDIKEAAVFLTGLANETQKKDFFLALKNSSITSVPFVHLRSNNTVEDMKFLMEEYGTRTFNIHLDDVFPLEHDLSKFGKYIFIENLGTGIGCPEKLVDYGGICADFSHLENTRVYNQEIYQNVLKLFSQYPIGCAHLSVIKSKPHRGRLNNGEWRVDSHDCENLAEFDYLKRYEQYLPDIMAIELNNDLKTQLEVRDYVKKILNI